MFCLSRFTNACSANFTPPENGFGTSVWDKGQLIESLLFGVSNSALQVIYNIHNYVMHKKMRYVKRSVL